METPLTPLEFARRARMMYPDREAVVDDGLRLTYEQFFDRCDRWSAVLQRQMGVRRGDRVAYIAPNTHAQLESFYAVPQLGAVLVPINYRLTAEDFAYIIQHCGARVVCAHPDYLDAIDRVRSLLPEVEHYVSLDGATPGGRARILHGRWGWTRPRTPRRGPSRRSRTRRARPALARIGLRNRKSSGSVRSAFRSQSPL